MFRKEIIVLFSMSVAALVVSCKEEPEKNGSCTAMSSRVGPPERIITLLEFANTFLVGRFENAENTASLTTHFTLPSAKCKDPARIADITDPTNVIYASPELEGPIGRAEALASGVRCKEVEHTQTVCDWEAVDAGAADAGCHEVKETTNTCKLPEWHFVIPDEDGKQWAMFLFKDLGNPNDPLFLTMRLEITDGAVDLSILEGGEKVPLEDMKVYLLKHVKPGIPLFWAP